MSYIGVSGGNTYNSQKTSFIRGQYTNTFVGVERQEQKCSKSKWKILGKVFVCKTECRCELCQEENLYILEFFQQERL